MSSALAIVATGPTQTANAEKPHLVRLWQDAVRVEQMARLHGLELQPGDDYGMRAWKLAYEQWNNLPETARIDLPSPHVFGRILGLMRTGATIKSGKLLRLEISAEDIGELIGYSKTTVEAALRWLSVGPIENKGVQLARGLGLIHRGRRTALGYLDGILRKLYRTSRTVLTLLGRMLLGLGERDEERKREQREAKERIKQDAKAAAAVAVVPAATSESTSSGTDRYDVGLAALRRIREGL